MTNATRRDPHVNAFFTLLAPVTVGEAGTNTLDAGDRITEETVVIFFGDLSQGPAVVQIFERDEANGGSEYQLEYVESTNGMQVVQRKIKRTRRWLKYVVTPVELESFNVAIYLMR